MNEQLLLKIIEMVAETYFDGHFTIMRFTTNWRVSFGYQPNRREDIDKMAGGKSLFEAFLNAVKEIDWTSLMNKVKE